MTESDGLIERKIASYLEYLELGGQRPDLDDLDPEARKRVDEVISMLEFTAGVPLGRGRRQDTAQVHHVLEGGATKQAATIEAGAVGTAILEELRSSLPAIVRLAPDPEVVGFTSPELPVVNGWTVGSFGGRVRVWVVDEPHAGGMDTETSWLHRLNRVFRVLPDTAAIALVFRDLTCLLVEPSDCGPTIEVPAGAWSQRRYRRPVQHVGRAVADFLNELIPSWESIPGRGDDELLPVDIEEIASTCAESAIQSQNAMGARARSPKKDVLTGLGREEITALAKMTVALYEERVRPEGMAEQLQRLGTVR